MIFLYFIVFLLHLPIQTLVSAASNQNAVLKLDTEETIHLEVINVYNESDFGCPTIEEVILGGIVESGKPLISLSCQSLKKRMYCQCEKNSKAIIKNGQSKINISCSAVAIRIPFVLSEEIINSTCTIELNATRTMKAKTFVLTNTTAQKSSTITPCLNISMCQCPSPVSTITQASGTRTNPRISSFVSDPPSSIDNVSEGQMSTAQPTQNKLVDSSCQDQKPLIDTIIIVVVVTSAINLVLFLTTVFVYRKYKLAQISIKVEPTEQPNRKSNLESTQTQTRKSIKLKPNGQPNRKSNLESTQTRKRTNSSPKILSSETDNFSAKSKTIKTGKLKSNSVTTGTPDLGPDTSEIKSLRPLFLQAQQIKDNPTPNPNVPNPPTTSRPITIETDIPTKTANKMNSKAEEWETTNENQNIKDLPIEIMKRILRHKKRNARK